MNNYYSYHRLHTPYPFSQTSLSYDARQTGFDPYQQTQLMNHLADQSEVMLQSPEFHFECPHKLCHVSETSRTVFSELDIIDEEQDSVESRPELSEYRKQLFGLNVPEVKTSTCYKTVKTKKPWGGWWKAEVPYPCIYRRTTNHRIDFVVKYPSTVENAVKNYITNCAITAAGAAGKTIYAAAAASTASGPGAIAAAAAAIPTALVAAKEAFWACMTGANLAENISKLIKMDIVHEKKTGDWKRA